MKNKKYHTFGTLPKSNRKLVEINTSANIGAGTAYPSGAPEFASGF
jgi:hypothetical protein